MSGQHAIAYQPALDSVRALAVTVVLLFHAGVPGFGGGYLGVSVFFTLSGFLITSLLLAERDGSGRIDLARFYSRRLRRLLPPSLVCLLAIVLIAAWTDVFDGVESLRRDVLGAVFQVSNWVFLAGEGSYQNLLAETSGTPSPVEHFWSLSIEEQFYWLWPPVMVLVLARAHSRQVRIVTIGAITLAFAAMAPLIAAIWGPDAAYWATPARVAEILAGALLAVVISRRTVDPRWHWAAPLALVALGAAVVLFPTVGGPAYNGALPLVGVGSALLVLGLQPAGPVRRAMSVTPMVWLGRISYGVYLYHWPIFLIATSDRTGVDGPALVALRLVLTLAVATLSYHVLEMPIRNAKVGKRPTFAAALTATGAVCVATLALAPVGVGQYWLDVADNAEEAAIVVDDRELAPIAGDAAGAATTSTTTTSTPPTTSTPQVADPVATTSTSTTTTTTTVPDWSTASLGPLPTPSRPVRIVVAGDSTAHAFGAGIVSWAVDNPELAQVEVIVRLGCGALVGGERLEGDTFRVEPDCDRWIERYLLPGVERLQPDVVMLLTTGWDVLDHRWEDGVARSPFDPEFVRRLEAGYREAIDGMLNAGASRVALVRGPIADPYWLPDAQDQEDPARYEILFEMFDRLAEDYPDTVVIVPLNTWFTENDLDRDVEVRPDGIHVAAEPARAITEDFLGDRLVRIALGLPVR